MSEFHDRGKIFWPIAVGECPDIDDAYATLYSLSEAELYLSFYDETGNTITNELTIEFQDIYANDEGSGYMLASLLKG